MLASDFTTSDRLQPLTLRGLADAFTVPKLKRAWKNDVRHGLRSQPLSDLHDFLDVHRHQDALFARLATDVVEGNYRPTPPQVVLSEKTLGMVRRLVFPNPLDALALQALVQVLEPFIRDAQPSQQSYYSRSHRHTRVEDFEEGFGYPWFVLWPAFQRRIWSFTEDRPFLVTTDVANYYDSIPFALLRSTLSGLGSFDQRLLDLLFFLLEHFMWRPAYLPLAFVGLPQLEFDAPRLLAHAYLFEADHFLGAATDGQFARWMDDINFGANSRVEAKQILGQLDRKLNAIGLRLNPKKTVILPAEEAVRHFWVSENQKLTVLENIVKISAGVHELPAEAPRYAIESFGLFYARPRVGHWDKVLKRYLTLFSRMRSDALVPVVPAALEEIPTARKACFRYYRTLGYDPSRLRHVESFLSTGHCLDDEAIFGAANLLVDWPIPPTTARRLVQLASGLAENQRSEACRFVAALWIVVKYGTRTDLMNFLTSHENAWRGSEWASRQVAAVLSRLIGRDRTMIEDQLLASGLLEGLRVLNHLRHLRQLPALDKQLRTYLLQPVHDPWSYPLPKVLIARAALDGALSPQDKDALRSGIAELTSDPVYRSWLGASKAPQSDQQELF
jgi:hypothetical protein